MKKKEKVVKDPWCPLTGDIEPYDDLILRARELWGVKDVVKDNVFHVYRPRKKVIEKAQKIYDRRDKFQNDPLELEMLEFKMSSVVNPRTAHREEYLKDITLLFAGLDASIQEVFSILAIYEARVSKNPKWPLELLMIAEKYSPNALLGKDRRQQVKEWQELRWKYNNSDAEKREWLKLGNEYRKKHPDKKLHSPRRVATHICEELSLPKKSFQTVYKYLLKNNV